MTKKELYEKYCAELDKEYQEQLKLLQYRKSLYESIHSVLKKRFTLYSKKLLMEPKEFKNGK